MYVCMHVCNYVRMYVCVYIYIHMCVYVYIYIYIYKQQDARNLIKSDEGLKAEVDVRCAQRLLGNMNDIQLLNKSPLLSDSLSLSIYIYTHM